MEKKLNVHHGHRMEWQGLLASVLLVLFGTPAAGAQTFDEAVAAYKRGDYGVVFEAFHALAEQGEVRAQYGLGLMYAEGQGVPPDDTAAVRWYRRAAEQGEADAQTSLGYMYAKGRGVPQDDTAAVRWYRQAAEQGETDAQFNLGVMYAKGRGVPQDDTAAVRWYRQAAEQGETDAQFNLGVMYVNGQGVPQDDVQAYKWVNLAASRLLASDQLREVVIRSRDLIASGMTPAQIAEAQRLVREWEPKPSAASFGDAP